MTLSLLNRVWVNIATTGTGTVTCGAAHSAAFLTMAEAGASDAIAYPYVLEEGTDFEEGTGTYTVSGTTFSRDTVTVSKIGGTNGTSKMNLAGAATLRIIIRSDDLTGILNWNANATPFLQAPTSSNLAALVTGETGTAGGVVFSVSPTFTGTPLAPTAAVDTNTTQIATTAMVLAQAASANPVMNGTVAVGTSTRYARADHVHATDTSLAPLASPTLTGTPTAPTAAAMTNTTQLATTAFVTGGTREKLTANRTYYVRTDGSDSNNGLADTAGGAWLTLQHAYHVIRSTLDFGGNSVVMQLGAGTYANLVISNTTDGAWEGGGRLQILGDNTTPSNVKINATSDDCIRVSTAIPGPVYITGVQFNTTTSGNALCAHSSAVKIQHHLCQFKNIAGYAFYADMTGGVVECVNAEADIGTMTFNGTCQGGQLASAGGLVRTRGTTCLLKNAPIFSYAFAVVYEGGLYTADFLTVTGDSVTFETTNDNCLYTAHGVIANQAVAFAGTMPSPLVAGTTYYAKTITDANSFTLSATAGGAKIDLTTTGSGCTIVATGPRYNISGNGVIYSGGGSKTSYLPGNAAGSGDDGTTTGKWT